MLRLCRNGRRILFGLRRYVTDANGPSAETKPVDMSALPEEVKAVLTEKDNKIRELQNAYLMSLADMENLRNRTKREVESASQYAIQKFCKDIISIADILEMALRSACPSHPLVLPSSNSSKVSGTKDGPEAEKHLGDLIEGLGITIEELCKIFAKYGITTIEPLGSKFDPNMHNALYEVPAEAEPGIVVAVQKRGYLLHGRVLRAADVGVSKKP